MKSAVNSSDIDLNKYDGVLNQKLYSLSLNQNYVEFIWEMDPVFGSAKVNLNFSAPDQKTSLIKITYDNEVTGESEYGTIVLDLKNIKCSNDTYDVTQLMGSDIAPKRIDIKVSEVIQETESDFILLCEDVEFFF